MRRFSGVIAVLFLVAVLGACNGDDDAAAPTSTTRAATSTSRSTTTSSTAPTTTTTAPRVTTTTACTRPAGGSTTLRTSPLPSDVMVLNDVTTRVDGCAATITFAFESGAPEAPGYRVEYQRGPFQQDPSGRPIAVAGSAFLVVRLEPATGFDFVQNKASYTGPNRIAIAAGADATEVVLLGDFESVMTWVIGVDAPRPFTVQASGAPDHRLTITVA